MSTYLPSPSKANNSNIDDSQRNTVSKPDISKGYMTPTGYQSAAQFNSNRSGGGNSGGLSQDNINAINTAINKDQGIQPALKSALTNAGYTVNNNIPTLTNQLSNQQNNQSNTNTSAGQSIINTKTSYGSLQNYGYVNEYKQSLGTSLKEFGGGVIQDAGQFFTGGGNYVNPFDAFAKTNLGSVGANTLFNLNPVGLNLNNIGFSSQPKSQRIYNVNIQKGKEESNIIGAFETNQKDYATNLSSSAQSEYNSAFDIAQGGVSSGVWSLSQGQDYLKQVGSSIDTKYKSQLDNYSKSLQTNFSSSIDSVESKYAPSLANLRYGTFDVGGSLAKGIPMAIETGIILAAPETGAGLIGTKEFILGAKEDNSLRMIGGAALLGGPIISQAIKLPGELAVGAATERLANQNFLFAEGRITGTSDFSMVAGTRNIDGFSGLTQNIVTSGKVLKSGELFLQPGSKFASTITGKIEPYFIGIGEQAPKAYLGSSIGEIGSKGFTLPVTGATDLFGTIGKGTIIIKEEGYGIVSGKSLKGGGYGFDSNLLKANFKTNSKVFENNVQSGFFSGFSKKLNDNTYLSISGKIDKMEFNPSRTLSSTRLTNEGLIDSSMSFSKKGMYIESNMKDITLTKIFPKSDFKSSTTIDFSGTKSGGQGLIQIPKSSFSGGSELMTQSIIQEARGSLVPKMITQSTSLSQKGFGISANTLSSFKSTPNQMSMSGLMTIQKNKDYSLGNFGNLNTGFGTITSPKVSSLNGFGSGTSFKQPSAQMSGLSSMQLTKTDLGLKSVSLQSLATPNITSTGFGGGFGGLGGFEFPGLGLPSFGAGLGISKPKVKGKKRKTKIRPSLTAELFDIRGALPKGGTFGITPFQLRAIPRGKGNPYSTKF